MAPNMIMIRSVKEVLAQLKNIPLLIKKIIFIGASLKRLLKIVNRMNIFILMWDQRTNLTLSTYKFLKITPLKNFWTKTRTFIGVVKMVLF